MFCLLAFGSLSRNIHSSLPKRRIFEYKDTNFGQNTHYLIRKHVFGISFLFFVQQIAMQNAQKSRDINDFLIRYVSQEEIEKFAKQIFVYNNPKIILFALSTTDVSKEARYICVVASESCPIPSLMTDKGTFFALAALAHE